MSPLTRPGVTAIMCTDGPGGHPSPAVPPRFPVIFKYERLIP